MGSSKMKTESARAEDAKEATAGRTPEGLDLDGTVWGPPTKGHRDPTLDVEWITLEAYGSMPRGHPGGEEGKDHSCGKQERPR